MAHAGDIIEGPAIGQKIEFEVTGNDNNGEITICHHHVAPKPQSIGPPLHIHKSQSETYRVITGTWGVHMDGEDHVMKPGDDIFVPAGVPHYWWNEGTEEAHVILEFRPAETIDAFFETLFGLSRDGKLDVQRHPGQPPSARPKSLVQAVALSYDHGIGLCDVPNYVQKFFFPVVAGAGRLVGIRGSYAKYSPS
jgi:mannose-6-phosphate isomerase-like protein (cupin superfamily)